MVALDSYKQGLSNETLTKSNGLNLAEGEPIPWRGVL